MAPLSDETVYHLKGTLEALVRATAEIAAFGLIGFTVPFLERALEFSLEFNLPSVVKASQPHLQNITAAVVIGIYVIMSVHILAVLSIFAAAHWKWGARRHQND